jgi:hypothetical protein
MAALWMLRPGLGVGIQEDAVEDRLAGLSIPPQVDDQFARVFGVTLVFIVPRRRPMRDDPKRLTNGRDMPSDRHARDRQVDLKIVLVGFPA